MRRNDIKQLATSSVEDLKKKYVELLGRLDQGRSDIFGGKSKNVRGLREVRRDIARVLTAMSSRS